MGVGWGGGGMGVGGVLTSSPLLSRSTNMCLKRKSERVEAHPGLRGTPDPQTDMSLAPVHHTKRANIFDPFQREPTFSPSCFLISVPHKKS